MEAIKQASKFKKLLKSDNINEVLQAVNDVVSIYELHKIEVDNKCSIKDFNPVNDVDFNVWAYTQMYKIEAIYKDLLSKYYDLHFDKYQFNAY
jgi:hypothetical protein